MATLQGKQSAAMLDFMLQTGYTAADIADKLHLHRDTVRAWVREAAFANWDDLAAIGLVKHDDVPTATEGREE